MVMKIRIYYWESCYYFELTLCDLIVNSIKHEMFSWHVSRSEVTSQYSIIGWQDTMAVINLVSLEISSVNKIQMIA